MVCFDAFKSKELNGRLLRKMDSRAPSNTTPPAILAKCADTTYIPSTGWCSPTDTTSSCRRLPLPPEFLAITARPTIAGENSLSPLTSRRIRVLRPCGIVTRISVEI